MRTGRESRGDPSYLLRVERTQGPPEPPRYTFLTLTSWSSADRVSRRYGGGPSRCRDGDGIGESEAGGSSDTRRKGPSPSGPEQGGTRSSPEPVEAAILSERLGLEVPGSTGMSGPTDRGLGVFTDNSTEPDPGTLLPPPPLTGPSSRTPDVWWFHTGRALTRVVRNGGPDRGNRTRVGSTGPTFGTGPYVVCEFLTSDYLLVRTTSTDGRVGARLTGGFCRRVTGRWESDGVGCDLLSQDPHCQSRSKLTGQTGTGLLKPGGGGQGIPTSWRVAFQVHSASTGDFKRSSV